MSDGPIPVHYEEGLQVREATVDDGLQVHSFQTGQSHVHGSPLSTNHPSDIKPSIYSEKQSYFFDKWKHASHTEKESVDDGALQKPTQSNKRRLLWIILGTILVLAIALGAGLGVGLTRSHNSNSSAGVAGDASSGSSPSGSPSADAAGVMNGTSLAAVMTADTTRYLFYQNSNGSIAYATYTMGSWNSNIVVAEARNSTPISAAVVGSDIMLLYANKDNTLEYTLYGQSQNWEGPFTTPARIAARSTSFSFTPVTCKDSTSGVVLLYESSNGINGIYGPGTDLTSIDWKDFSANLTGPTWSTLGSPVTTGNSYLDGGLTVNAFFYNRQSLDYNAASILREVSFSNFSTCHISQGSNLTTTDLSDALRGLSTQNDLVMFPLLQYPWFVINGSLSSVNGPGGLKALDTAFPFTKLASINVTSQNLYLYNQLNTTTFLEHIAADRGNWTTNTIHVASG